MFANTIGKGPGAGSGGSMTTTGHAARECPVWTRRPAAKPQASQAIDGVEGRRGRSGLAESTSSPMSPHAPTAAEKSASQQLQPASRGGSACASVLASRSVQVDRAQLRFDSRPHRRQRSRTAQPQLIRELSAWRTGSVRPPLAQDLTAIVQAHVTCAYHLNSAD